MARQVGPFFITGTLRGITYYKMGKVYYARSKSSIDGKRMKMDKAFRKTMENAGLFGKASKIASHVYGLLDHNKKDIQLYRKWTGIAMKLLSEGKMEWEAINLLCLKAKKYLVVAEEKILTPKITELHKCPIISITGYHPVFLSSLYQTSSDNTAKFLEHDKAFSKKSKCYALMR